MRIAVAGAGIAGLTAALAAARRGLTVDLYERAPALEETGAGIQLSPNAMAVLERLDLMPALSAALVEPRSIEIRDAGSAARLTSIPLGEMARRRYGSPYAVIRRSALQAALLAAVRSEPRILLHFGTEIRRAQLRDDGVVLVTGEGEAEAELLVGADGVHSTLRTNQFGEPGPQILSRTAWRATLAAAAIPADVPRDATCLWLGRGMHVVHYPVDAGVSLNIVAIGPSAAGFPPFAGVAPGLAGLLAAVPEWSAWPLLSVDPARPWVKGRVVLIGDAAHAMPPSAAQGGALALEDAWVLAACLTAAPHAAAALSRYEQARRARVLRAAREAARNLNIYGLQGVAAHARNLAIAALPGRLHLARLDWLYGWQPPG